MRFSRESYVDPGNESFVRYYIYSEFSGPWPEMTISEQKAAVALIQEGAEFAGLIVRAFAVTGISLHILVDEAKECRISDREMLRRFAATKTILYENERPLLEAKNPEAWSRLRKRFGSLAPFIKRLKQVISQRYHGERGTRGTLWQTRFSNTFVQVGPASSFVAAWIAFANVRCGKVADLRKDGLSFYGRAVSGDLWARAMVASLFAPSRKQQDWATVNKAFQNYLKSEPEGALQKPKNSKLAPYLTRSQTLRTEIPNLAAGLAVGDQDYLQEFFQRNRVVFGKNREIGGRIILGQNDPNLFTARQKRDLRKL